MSRAHFALLDVEMSADRYVIFAMRSPTLRFEFQKWTFRAVKRLETYDGGWWVGRDNPDEGVDSWTLGAAAEAVLAVAVLRVWPRPGRLRRPAGADPDV